MAASKRVANGQETASKARKEPPRPPLSVMDRMSWQYSRDVSKDNTMPEDFEDWQADLISGFEAGWRAAMKYLADASGEE